ncbi:hypothetical protein CAPTEDRAFT_200083 [Capitella teleta]|uniref:Uncharacterized protein n=1 Tax=Capitella teleta TaxID=283909 RepID=R7URE6_CAPTE|nr:hypothetical protein CAPTEDRAFT_200083 [Capitella teleta]|eukprot:ELU09079.1 hypothetical protein CAPTEDRAFT_200083 [Capitella teleta]
MYLTSTRATSHTRGTKDTKCHMTMNETILKRDEDFLQRMKKERYPQIKAHFEKIYNDRKAWAFCYRADLPVLELILQSDRVLHSRYFQYKTSIDPSRIIRLSEDEFEVPSEEKDCEYGNWAMQLLCWLHWWAMQAPALEYDPFQPVKCNVHPCHWSQGHPCRVV